MFEGFILTWNHGLTTSYRQSS